MERRNWEETCALLREQGYLNDDSGFLGPSHPRLPAGMPSWDDNAGDGIALYKGGFERGTDLSNLTLPRTFISRSLVEAVSFVNTDLSDSWCCWNNFEDVDFSDAVLRGCDLRASEFVRVRFKRADLSGADLRQCFFSECDFSDACMAGAILSVDQAERLALSPQQRDVISWAKHDGEEPPGG